MYFPIRNGWELFKVIVDVGHRDRSVPFLWLLFPSNKGIGKKISSAFFRTNKKQSTWKDIISKKILFGRGPRGTAQQQKYTIYKR